MGDPWQALTACSLLQVNGQALSKAFSPQTKPWIALARALGTVLCTVGKQMQGSLQVCTLGEPGCGDPSGQAREQIDRKVVNSGIGALECAGMDGWWMDWVERPAPGWPIHCRPDLSAAGSCTPPPCTPGTPLKEAGSYLTPAVAAGMLAGGTQKEVTLVNATLLAQEAGLKVRGHPGSAPQPGVPFPASSMSLGTPRCAANAALRLAVPWGDPEDIPSLPQPHQDLGTDWPCLPGRSLPPTAMWPPSPTAARVWCRCPCRAPHTR